MARARPSGKYSETPRPQTRSPRTARAGGRRRPEQREADGVHRDRAVQQAVQRQSQGEPAADQPPEGHAGDQGGHRGGRAGLGEVGAVGEHVGRPQRHAELHGDAGGDHDPGDPVAAGQPTRPYAGRRSGGSRDRRGAPAEHGDDAHHRDHAAAAPAASRGRPRRTARPPAARPAPTAAATALASVIAAGPVSWCIAASTVEVQVTTNEPPNEHRKAPNRVTGTAVNAVRTTMPPHSSTRPAQIIAVRPNRVASGATHRALSRAPTARAVPCSPATVRLNPSSSRSRVRAGPNP